MKRRTTTSFFSLANIIYHFLSPHLSLGEPGFYVCVIYIGSGAPTGTSRVSVLPEANFVNFYLHGACGGDIGYLAVPFRDETWF